MDKKSRKETIQYWKRRRRGLFDLENPHKLSAKQERQIDCLFKVAEKWDAATADEYVHVCDCAQANIVNFGELPKHNGGPNPGKDHPFSKTPVTPTKDGNCPYCGYVAQVVNSSSIGDCNAFGRGLRGKNKHLSKRRFV